MKTDAGWQFSHRNPAETPADLGGLYLTDDLANRFQFEIPQGYVAPPHGFLLVWADNQASCNRTNDADLHVNFQLAGGGEQLGLFAPDGAQVDGFAFVAQTNDVSTGRFPDGAARFVSRNRGEGGRGGMRVVSAFHFPHPGGGVR